MHQILLILTTILVFLYFLSSSAAFDEDDADDHDDQGRVIGGIAVGAGKYPFIASLQQAVKNSRGKIVGWGHVCGCTILNDNSILTAAHCVTNSSNLKQKLNPNDYRVQIGTIIIGEKGGGQFINVSKLTPHKHYTGDNGINNDIAIVKLKKKISFSSSLTKSCLAGDNDEADMGSCKVIGWGLTEPGPEGPTNQPSLKLMEVSLPMKSPSECVKKGGNSKRFCAANPKGSACNGDSGGPYICKVKGKSDFLQFGLVSYGEPGCPLGHPSYYTRVGAYISWIQPIAED